MEVLYCVLVIFALLVAHHEVADQPQQFYKLREEFFMGLFMLSDTLMDELGLQIGFLIISALNELVILEKRAARIFFFWYLLFRVKDKQTYFDA